jgi:hypothetical protein
LLGELVAGLCYGRDASHSTDVLYNILARSEPVGLLRRSSRRDLLKEGEWTTRRARSSSASGFVLGWWGP